MNQNEQMREALQRVRDDIESLTALQNGTVNHVVESACGTLDRVLQALSATVKESLTPEPAPLVRLTEDEVWQIQRACSFEFTQRKFANAIMDAMIAKNGGRP